MLHVALHIHAHGCFVQTILFIVFYCTSCLVFLLGLWLKGEVQMNFMRRSLEEIMHQVYNVHVQAFEHVDMHT